MAIFQAGPYQSQVFRFINRQVRRWRDRLEVTLRQLKVVASWSGQILLYPVYVAYQAARLASAKVQQLTASYPSQKKPAEPGDRPIPPQVDTPVQQVIQLAQTLITEPPLLAGSRPYPALSPPLPGGQLVSPGNPALTHQPPASQELAQPPDGYPTLANSVNCFKPSNDSAIEVLDSACLQPGETNPGGVTGPIKIQGIATLLATRGLVLVTDQNQILDVLTPTQQRELRQRMIWEMATYGRYQRLQRVSQRVLARIRPANPDSRVLGPVKQFQALMAWVQRGSVAITANLFQEATLEPDFPLATWDQSVLWPIASPFVAAPEPLLPSGPEQLAIPDLLVEPDRYQEPPGPLVSAPLAALTHSPVSGQPIVSQIRPELEGHSYQPQYIDIQATLVEYTQTHLQNLLRLLDKFFFWLEKYFTLIWRRFF